MDLENDLSISGKEFRERLKRHLIHSTDLDFNLFMEYFLEKIPLGEISLEDINNTFKEIAIKVYEGRGWFRNKDVPASVKGLRKDEGFAHTIYICFPDILSEIGYRGLEKSMEELIDRKHKENEENRSPFSNKFFFYD